jgi:hypothetical protein
VGAGDVHSGPDDARPHTGNARKRSGGKQTTVTPSDERPSVATTDRWQTVAAWLKNNPTAVITILTAFGFVLGGFILAAFASGLRIGVTDFGLDVRATVMLAGGTLVYPAFLAALPLFTERQNRGGRTNAALYAVAIFVAGWWLYGLELWRAALAGAATGVIVLVIRRSIEARSELSAPGRAVVNAVERFVGPDSQGLQKRLRRSVLYFTVGAVVTAISMPYGALTFGRSIQSDSGDSPEPRFIKFVLPVIRGTVTLGDRSVCVDRVGQRVMVGDESTAVVPEWDGFVVEDCDRGDVSELFD